jgi:2-methylcitrate dehydratase PrpD
VSAPVPLARRLAEEIAAPRAGALSAPVLARAAVLLRDYVGVTLGGAGEDSTRAIRKGLETLHSGGTGTVLGTTVRFPPPAAALANGAAAHALEMDDTHLGGSIHLGASVFPAALAAAELRGAGGDLVLRAAVAGYEVAARLAMALGPAAHYRRGFHPTGTCGAFGAAAAAGLVFGLDVPALTAALGIAGSQASGSMEFLSDGTWTKRFHPGWAACAGLHAAALADAGFAAPATILEGRFGFLHAYSDAGDAAALLGGDGYELCRTGIKPHACCRYAQGPIDAALALRATHRIAASDVTRVEVGVLAAALPIICEPLEAKRRPGSVVDAQFSLPFAIAVALARGAASPAEFVPATLTDPVVKTLMERVVPVHDRELDAVYPRAWPSWVRVTLRGGAAHEARVEHPRGDPENFPTPAELETKFRTLAARTLDPASLDRVAAALDAFPATAHVDTLLAATVPGVR